MENNFTKTVNSPLLSGNVSPVSKNLEIINLAKKIPIPLVV